MTELLTWGSAGTLGVATLFTLGAVQYLKPIKQLQGIDTRIIAYIIAVLLLVCATAFTTPTNVGAYVLAVFNAVIVAIAAMGLYEVTFKKRDAAKKAL